MITDKEIIERYCNKLGRPSNKRLLLLTKDDEAYLNNRFNDCSSIPETVYRITNNIEVAPVCKYCGKKLNYPYNKGGYCSKSCASKATANVTVKKSKQTKQLHYADPNYNNKDTCKKTCLERYGVAYGWNNNTQKETVLYKYGVNNPAKSDKIKQKTRKTCIERYGVATPLLLDDVRQKADATKLKNSTYKKSNAEDRCYEMLKSVHPDIIRQYRSKLYPFNCDFYVPSKNLYIEFQGSQFHNFRPYTGSLQDLDEVERLKEIISKNKRHLEGKKCQLENVLETWTVRDTLKRKTTKENNLNYIEFWNLKEVRQYIENCLFLCI